MNFNVKEEIIKVNLELTKEEVLLLEKCLINARQQNFGLRNNSESKAIKFSKDLENEIATKVKER